MLRGKQFSFISPCQILLGRSRDCDLVMPNDFLHWDVSRRHCLLVADGRFVTIRDLGSRNGTYVNGRRIGQRARGVQPKTATRRLCSSLREGDQIRIANTVFQIEVHPDAVGTDERTESLGREPALAG